MAKRRLSISQPGQSAKRSNISNLTFDDGMEAINSAIHNLDSNDVGIIETIQQTTTMLNELEKARAYLFSIRARALGKQGGFDEAIADAHKAIDSSPTSEQFYQLVGALHIAHGKPKLAVKALEKGICSTFPSDWPSLYNSRESATRILEAKVDFVSTMPPEVTARIFMCLNDVNRRDNGAFNCALVSRRWRSMVLSCSKLWEVAKYPTRTNKTFLFLPSVSSYVKEIDIDDLTDKSTQKLMTLATHDKLQSVTKLTFGFYHPRFNLILLSTLSKQLTELKLDYTCDGTQQDVFSLGEILTICKSLKALTILYEGPRIQYHQPSHVPFAETLELEMLSIWAPVDNGDFLQQLIPQCRQMRFLSIANFPREALELATELHLQLEEICITTAEDCREEIWWKVYQKHQQPATGLRKLEFISGEFGISLRDIMPLWIKWKHTLEELTIEMCDDDIETMEPKHWDSLVSGRYPHLKSLRLVSTDGNGSQVADHILRLLQSCPALENISLYIENMTSNDLFTRFDALQYLRRLQISYLDTCGGLQECFESLSKRDQKCNLKEISINSCEAVTDQILEALAGVPSLEHISIFGPHAQVSSSGIEAFLRKLKSNPNLRCLDLRSMANFTEDCVAELNKLVELDGAGDKCNIKKFSIDSVERYETICYKR